MQDNIEASDADTHGEFSGVSNVLKMCVICNFTPVVMPLNLKRLRCDVGGKVQVAQDSGSTGMHFFFVSLQLQVISIMVWAGTIRTSACAYQEAAGSTCCDA